MPKILLLRPAIYRRQVILQRENGYTAVQIEHMNAPQFVDPETVKLSIYGPRGGQHGVIRVRLEDLEDMVSLLKSSLGSE